MKISKGWTHPGTGAYTSRRGDVEVDTGDLERILQESNIDIAIAISEKDVFRILDAEAEKYVTLQQIAIGVIATAVGTETLTGIQQTQKSVLEKYK